ERSGERVDGDVFCEHRVGASLCHLAYQALAGRVGEDDNPDVGGSGTNQPHGVGCVHFGAFEIHHDNVQMLGGDVLDGSVNVAHLAGKGEIRESAEEERQPTVDKFAVVNEKNA